MTNALTKTQPEENGFGSGQQFQVARNQTASAAAAAQAQAQVQARYIVAIQNPRNYDLARQRLIKECKRKLFAESAEYSKPMGRGAPLTGPSIRFAETALRCWGNVAPEDSVVYDDENQRIVKVSVTDYESNLTYSRDVTIEKTVERRSDKGRDVVSQRMNSYGDTVYVVRATEDEVLTKQNAQVSKALRVCALRILPGDLVEECLSIARQTAAAEWSDPDAARKKIMDAFATFGVSAQQVTDYVEHTNEFTPAEVATLRGLYNAIKAGETSWKDAVSDKAEGKPGPTAPEAPEEPEGKSEAEAESIREAMSAAQTSAELLALAGRIKKLPKELRENLQASYEIFRDDLSVEAGS